MKTKFVNVWDNRRWGYIGYIILQVEESDIFLTEKNFNPGYKFIIQAWYNNVGAAGGHTFIPSHGESVQEKTRKISTNEADVLGLYLSNVDDIYNIPDELHTEKFWGIVYTKMDVSEELELNFPYDNYYKVAYRIKTPSWNKNIESLDRLTETCSSVFSKDTLCALNDTIKWMTEIPKSINADLDSEHTHVKYGYINKETLKLEWETYCSCSKETIINEYLWDPHDELPVELWEKVKKLNSFLEVDGEESITLSENAELYYGM